MQLYASLLTETQQAFNVVLILEKFKIFNFIHWLYLILSNFTAYLSFNFNALSKTNANASKSKKIMQNQTGILKTAKNKLTSVGLLVAANVLATVNTIMAQSDPAVENIKKTTEAAKDMKDEFAREEMMGYVYMVVGFGLVIAIAWFTNTRVQKRRNEEAAQKAAARQHHHHHHSHDPHHRTSVNRRRPATKVN